MFILYHWLPLLVSQMCNFFFFFLILTNYQSCLYKFWWYFYFFFLSIVSHRSHQSEPGTVLCVGNGDVGQLGLGPDTLEKTRPGLVNITDPIVQVCAGGMHTVCLSKTGKVSYLQLVYFAHKLFFFWGGVPESYNIGIMQWL